MADKYPFGQTVYLNYDPEQINSLEDVVSMLEWLSDENMENGKFSEADCYRDAAKLISNTLIEDNDKEE